jgi:hypothetical protein
MPFVVSVVQVQDEHLSSHFVGLIGLALERNSILASKAEDDPLQFPVSTFSTNIFAGTTPPTSRTIGVSLERPGQSNSGTPSLLSIGRHPTSLVPDPSKILYTPLNGDTYWRVQVTQISAWVPGDWSDNASSSKRGLQARGAYSSGVIHNLALGSTQVTGAHSIWPLAIVDTGGARIITSRDLANAFWGAYGVGPASDGMCESEFFSFSLRDLQRVVSTFRGRRCRTVDVCVLTFVSQTMFHARNLSTSRFRLGMSTMRYTRSTCLTSRLAIRTLAIVLALGRLRIALPQGICEFNSAILPLRSPF